MLDEIKIGRATDVGLLYKYFLLEGVNEELLMV